MTSVETVTAQSAEHAQELVRHAADARHALVPVGGGLAIEQGNPVRALRWRYLAMTELDSVTDYEPDDTVISVQAGARFDEIQTAMAPHRQCVALDPPCPERATAGGVVATAATGLLRARWGSPRDHVLAVRAVLADGSAVRFGRSIMKDVAGLDMCRLLTGSWGTLGLITEVTLRAMPLPEESADLAWTGVPSEALASALRLQTSLLQVDYCAVVWEREGPARLQIGLSGRSATVAWLAQEVRQMMNGHGLREAASAARGDLLELPVRDATPAILHVVAPAPALPELVHVARENTEAVRVLVGSGSADLCLRPSTTRRQAAALAASCAERWRVHWSRLPVVWQGTIDAWGPRRDDHSVMRAIKQSLDPIGIFSPGRFAGGI